KGDPTNNWWSRLLDAVLLELVVKRARFDAEKASCLGLDPAGLRVRLEDQLTFEIVEDFRQRHLTWDVQAIFLGASLEELRERRRLDLLALGEDQGLLDRVL